MIAPPLRAGAALLLVAIVAGCDRDPDTRYGTVRGESLNGVSAFVQLLRDAGHRTATRRWLTERMVGGHDVAIVFADGFGPPDDDARELFGRFLEADGAQTLVFVVRDSDAAIDYWRTIAATGNLPADKAAAARARLQEAELEVRVGGELTFPAAEGDDAPPAFGLADRGEEAAGASIDVAGAARDGPVRARWSLQRRLEPAAGARPVWTHDGEPLLVESGSVDRTLVLVSAAPLLNGGLVDPGNRRLAAALVAGLPQESSVVVVGSTTVRPQDDDEAGPSTWRLLAVAPHPWIAAQALLAIVLFCWWKAPIFGRPRQEDERRAQNFGLHVAALAALLRASHDEDFARGRLEAWRRRGERDLS